MEAVSLLMVVGFEQLTRTVSAARAVCIGALNSLVPVLCTPQLRWQPHGESKLGVIAGTHPRRQTAASTLPALRRGGPVVPQRWLKWRKFWQTYRPCEHSDS